MKNELLPGKKRIQKSVFLTPDQAQALESFRPEGLSVSDFIIQSITQSAGKVAGLPVAKYDEWLLVSQLLRDDGDHSWVGRVGSEKFAETACNVAVAHAESSGLRGTGLLGAIGRVVRSFELDRAKSEDYTFAASSDVRRSVEAVQAHYARRQLIKAANNAIGRLQLEEDPGPASTELVSLVGSSSTESRGTLIIEALRESAIQAKRDEEEDASGRRLSLGYAGLTSMIPRVRRGDVIIVAARANVGKSLIVANIAHSNAKAGMPVAIFALEMERSQMAERIASVESGRPNKCANGRLNLSDAQFLAGMQATGKLCIHIDDRASLSGEQIWSALSSMTPKPSLAIIDYIGLMKHPDNETNAYAIGLSMKTIKAIGKSLGMAMVVLAQINRAGGLCDKPLLAHLRDSGDLEQDCDYAILGRLTDKDDVTKRRTTWEVAKNRHFPSGFGEIVLARYENSARLVEVQCCNLTR